MIFNYIKSLKNKGWKEHFLIYNNVWVKELISDVKQKDGEAFSLEKSMKRQTHKSLVYVWFIYKNKNSTHD